MSTRRKGSSDTTCGIPMYAPPLYLMTVLLHHPWTPCTNQRQNKRSKRCSSSASPGSGQHGRSSTFIWGMKPQESLRMELRIYCGVFRCSPSSQWPSMRGCHCIVCVRFLSEAGTNAMQVFSLFIASAIVSIQICDVLPQEETIKRGVGSPLHWKWPDLRGSDNYSVTL